MQISEPDGRHVLSFSLIHLMLDGITGSSAALALEIL